MGWWAVDGHCYTEYLEAVTQRMAIVRILLWAEYLGGGTQRVAIVRILLWAGGQGMATVIQNI